MKNLMKYALCLCVSFTSLSGMAANKTITSKQVIQQVLAYLPKTSAKIKAINASDESSGKQTVSSIIVNYKKMESQTFMRTDCLVQGFMELTYNPAAGDVQSGRYFEETLVPCPKKLIQLITP